MTDEEAIRTALDKLEDSGNWSTLKRNGRLLLALPPNREAAAKALNLYQPQRWKARMGMVLLGIGTAVGMHRYFGGRISHDGKGALRARQGVEPGTTGVMLGSPEHKVRRAIASFRTDRGWEVAKFAFGPEGEGVIGGEAAVLKSLPVDAAGKPELMDVSLGDDCSFLCLPYLEGTPLESTSVPEVVNLLGKWDLGEAPMPATEFPEWKTLVCALEGSEAGQIALQRLSDFTLRPVVRHGDFARWNLIRRPSGELVALDWEWGQSRGMPGIDLVHFFAQDARLVERLAPAVLVRRVCSLMRRAECRDYLVGKGWGIEPEWPMLVSLAFTYGSGQQANGEVLKALLDAVE